MKTHQRLGVWNSDIGRGLWWKQWIGTRLGPNDLRRLRSNRKWFVVRPLGRGFENARSWILAGLLCRTKQWTLQLNDHRSQPSRWYCCLQALGHQLHSKWKPTVRYGQRGYHRPEKWPAPSGWSSVSLPFLQWRHFFFSEKGNKVLNFWNLCNNRLKSFHIYKNRLKFQARVAGTACVGWNATIHCRNRFHFKMKFKV